MWSTMTPQARKVGIATLSVGMRILARSLLIFSDTNLVGVWGGAVLPCYSLEGVHIQAPH